MDELNQVKMIERVRVAKFDKTHEDDPVEPIEVVEQETVTMISFGEAMLMGFVPKGEQVGATGTVQIGTADDSGPQVSD